MDSMRSLNKSLPSASSKQPAPPEQLLQAFRQAALSVTNLYKSAASDHDSIRQAGYQEAIDDLLKFLDRENLGVQDGEGWRIRQWATARYDGSHLQQSDSDEEEGHEGNEVEQRQRSSSPEKPVVDEEEDEAASAPTQTETYSSESNHSEHQEQTQVPKQPVFHFSGGTDNAMQTDDPQPSSSQERPPPVRLEVINHTNRNAHKHNNRHHTPRVTTRSTPQNAGSKRKLPFPDMSEIFNVGFGKKDGFDGSGGGGGGGGGGSKRNRLV